MRHAAYPVRLRKDDNGTILVTSRDLPELTTAGDDEADALRRAVDALTATLALYIEDRRDIPAPSRARKGERVVAADPIVAAKILLWASMRDAGVTQAQLARRLGWKAPQVHRLLDPTHASRIEQIAEALATLGKSLEVRIRQAA